MLLYIYIVILYHYFFIENNIQIICTVYLSSHDTVGKVVNLRKKINRKYRTKFLRTMFLF